MLFFELTEYTLCYKLNVLFLSFLFFLSSFFRCDLEYVLRSHSKKHTYSKIQQCWWAGWVLSNTHGLWEMERERESGEKQSSLVEWQNNGKEEIFEMNGSNTIHKREESKAKRGEESKRENKTITPIIHIYKYISFCVCVCIKREQASRANNLTTSGRKAT